MTERPGNAKVVGVMAPESNEIRPLRGRLRAVGEAVPPGSRVADLGSDHGRLPRFLVVTGRAERCIATEPAAGPFRRLGLALAAAGLEGRVEARRGAGLDPLRPGDALDVVVAAGMGGFRMLDFLDPPRLAELGVRTLVLQPQSEWARVRREADARGWPLAGERLVLDRGRYYTVMVATTDGTPETPAAGFTRDEWFEAGPCLLRDRDPLAGGFWRRRLERAERRAERAGGPGRTQARAEAALARRVLAALAGPQVG